VIRRAFFILNLPPRIAVMRETAMQTKHDVQTLCGQMAGELGAGTAAVLRCALLLLLLVLVVSS
jgi:hypothetical protein